MDRHAWIKSKRKKRLRLLALVMCASLLATANPGTPEALSVLAAAEGQETGESLCIFGFEELSEEIREQYVPVGTKLEELTLPNELEAFAGETEGKADSGADDGKTEDGTGSEGTSGEEDASDGGNETGEGDGENEEDSGEQDGQETGDGGENDGTEESGGESSGIEDSGEGDAGTEEDGGEEDAGTEDGEGQDTRTEEFEEGAGTEESDAGNSTGSGGESRYSDEPEETAVTQETHTVTLPEYQAEHVLTVETLENPQDTEQRKTEDQKKEGPGEAEEPEEATETAVTVSGVTWQSEPAYDGDTAGTYIFTAILPGGGYTLADGVTLPQITVNVAESGAKPRRAAARAATHGNHCVCGGSVTTGGHSCNAGVEWTEWTQTSSLPRAAGNYYLTCDIKITSTGKWDVQNDIKLCLNGHTVSYTRNSADVGVNGLRCVEICSGGSLSVCDCQGGGRLCLTYNHNSNQSGSGMANFGTFCLYSGSIIATSGVQNADGLFNGLGSGSEGTTYLYGGSISATANQVSVTAVSDGGTAAYIYGGTYTARGMAGGTDYGLGISHRNKNTVLVGSPVFSPASAKLIGGTIMAKEGSLTYTGNMLDVTAYFGYDGLAVGALDDSTRDKFHVTSENEAYKVIPRVIYPAQNGIEYILVEGPNTVTYDANGGTGEMAPQVFYWYGEDAQPADAILSKNTFTQSGYVFDGWNTDKEGKGKAYADGADISGEIGGSEKTIPLYAKWKADTCTVSFDANGGLCGTAEKTVTYGQQYGELPTPTRAGYVFDGWHTAADGGSEIKADSKVAVTKAQTLYAHWSPVAYTITYDLEGGTVNGTNPASYTVQSSDITLINPTKTGHTFAGWSGTDLTGSYNKNVTIAEGSTGDREYTAHWEADRYTVTLNGNGGSGAELADGTYTYGMGAALPTDWTKTGYTFAGWYDNEDCTGTAVTAISAAETGDKEYWAKWTADTYRLTYDYHGADGGNDSPGKDVTYDSPYGELPAPTKTKYAFKGWYTEADGQGSRIEPDTTVTTAAAHTLHACWKDETAPDRPVLPDGTVLPTDWTNAQGTIPLTLHDSVGVAELWVSIDGNDYIKVDGFPGGTGTVAYDFPLTEGEHTYQFQTKDAAGNTSEGSDVITVKLDTAKPVIGDITYENKTANLWNWIIGKKSMVIHVPVTDEGSGVEEITYTMTPADAAGHTDSGNAVTRKVSVRDGEAKIIFDADFRGIIGITCTDAAGNSADSVTVGASGGGVIVEDRAPDITIQADRSPSDTQQTQPGGVDVSEGYYETAPALSVTVKDDTGSVVTAGIATVTWQAGDGAPQPVTVNTNTLQTAAQVTFTIPASEISTGITTIKIHAADNAGNESTETITVKVKGPEKQPAAAIDYREKKLTGLVPGGKYIIDSTEVTVDGEGCVPIAESWFDKTVSIIKKGSGSETSDSPAQSLPVPAVPAKPEPKGVDVDTAGGTGKLTGLTAGMVYEVSTDGGSTWETERADEGGAITGLAPGIYTVRVKAGTSNFASEPSGPAKIGAYQVTVIFMANGETYQTLTIDYGGTLTDIPGVPPKKDAGGQTYAGEWCSDEQGTPAVFTGIMADMTVYAVYTRTYSVTLQSGTGYTLSAETGSASPVREGGSYTFRFALASGYEKTGSFAVKVNGTAAELSEDGVYTISGITEDKTVTVEGVRKKGSSGGGSDKDKDKEPGGGDDPGKEEGIPQPTTPDPARQPGTSAVTHKPPKPSDRQTDTQTPSATPADTLKSETRPGGRTRTKPDAQEGKPDGTQPEDIGKPETAGKTDGTGTGQTSEGEYATTPAITDNGGIVTATVDNGRIITADGPVRTGNVKGMAGTSNILRLGNGAVIVTVVCEEQTCTAGVADTAAVADAVLTPEQTERVNSGETIEIRVDVADISDRVPRHDKEVIDRGMEEYRKEVSGLTLGMYVDISMFMKIGTGGWNAITATGEPVEVVIGIPEELQETGRVYYIIRAHEGEYTLMDDMDGEQDTITISTELFSSYAIAYEEAEGAADEKCGLCHICPTFLGICLFIWLAAIIVLFLIAGCIIWRMRRGREEQEIRA